MANSKNILLLFICLISSRSTLAQSHQANLAKVVEEKKIMKQLLVINNDKSQLPIVELSNFNIASINLDFQFTSVFDSIANKFVKVETFGQTYNSTSSASLNILNDDLKLYNYVILKTSKPLSKELISFIKEIEITKKVVITLTGTHEKSLFNNFQFN